MIVLWAVAFAFLGTYRFLFSFDNSTRTTIVLALLDVVCLYFSSIIVNRVLIPRFLYRKKILIFLILITMLIMVQSTVIKAIQTTWYHITGPLDKKSQAVFDEYTYQIFNTWLIAVLGFICICFFRVITDHYIAQKRYATVLKEKVQTELEFLKAQVNPHFLFNSINSVYGIIDKNNALARDTLFKFSEMLRYQLYECSSNIISIQKEMRYLLYYVELQKLRIEHLAVKVDIQPNLSDFEIAPLLFMPFVENAFKYVSTDERKNNKISISLTLDINVLIFQVHNTREKNFVDHLMSSKGIGLNNVKRRLELLYPSQHELTTESTEDSFDIILKIHLHETQLPDH
ncbi:MAG: histidine kinase [Flavipsychrobacter sp.]|nr:histidine kinase [Flavipsychrobacter sp.]